VICYLLYAQLSVRRAETFSVRKKKAAIKFEKCFVDPGGFWLSYQDPLHSERG
jgi:hypothetical protein